MSRWILYYILNRLKWKELTPAAQWSPRSSFSAVVIDNEIVITNGYNVTSVWSSIGGINWINLTSWTGITYRSAYPSIVYQNSIISMGGCNRPDTEYGTVELV